MKSIAFQVKLVRLLFGQLLGNLGFLFISTSGHTGYNNNNNNMSSIETDDCRRDQKDGFLRHEQHTQKLQSCRCRKDYKSMYYFAVIYLA